MSGADTVDTEVDELTVTFNPPLYLQRRAWIFGIMRRERVLSVVDVGCGEGELTSCLCNPAPWLVAPGHDTTQPEGTLSLADTITPEAHEDTVTLARCIQDDYMHLRSIHALDTCPFAVELTAKACSAPLDSADGFWGGYVRWEDLDLKIWKGGLEVYNPEFVGVDCIICTEVIEHLPEDVFHELATMLLGVYHPRLLLLTTPSYTFNARFTAPDAPPGTRKGFLDPSGRTNRIFRHDDHQFEWTVDEFAEWCRETSDEWGYEAEISGVGRAQETDEWGRDEALGYASQVVVFRRKDGEEAVRLRERNVEASGIWERTTKREKHQSVSAHQYAAHMSAGHASTVEDIGELVRKTVAYWNVPTATLHELWFEGDISRRCGGRLDVLIAAVEAQEEFAWESTGTKPSDWVLRWSGFVEPADEEKVEEDMQSTASDFGDVWGVTSRSATAGDGWGTGWTREGSEIDKLEWGTQTSSWGASASVAPVETW